MVITILSAADKKGIFETPGLASLQFNNQVLCLLFFVLAILNLIPILFPQKCNFL